MTDKVLCPWCGSEMEIRSNEYDMDEYLCWSECTNGACMAEGPSIARKNYDVAVASAKAAALRRYEPPCRPMTLEEVKEYVKDIEAAPVWMEDRNDALYTRWMTVPFLILIINEEKNNLAEYGKTWRCWPRKPTDAEMKEAKWDD